MNDTTEQPASTIQAASSATQDANSSFHPSDRTLSQPAFNTSNEQWTTILESPCTFPPEIFSDVMLNLVKNPNLTSSHLFRADIFYDSDKDATTGEDDNGNITTGMLAKQLKAEYRPFPTTLPGYNLHRTIVRQLVPRNPQLDKPLVQTCHFFRRANRVMAEDNLVMYIPHVSDAGEIPFYHPSVQRLAFRHICADDNNGNTTRSISISFQFFSSHSINTKLSRTALKLLQTVHKHGQGRLAGYEKRVHLDRILPQKRYQDTYARLKATYGKQLASQWVEVTDPGKHVFEDIGIAAFLVELWRDMYALTNDEASGNSGQRDGTSKPAFPGFVDIGCGNGVLTYILLSEGYSGWGFDARERKTWKTFPSLVQANLQRRIVVPDIFQTPSTVSSQTEHTDTNTAESYVSTEPLWHNGIFPLQTFIISNHADELTPWTPLLAFLNQAAFIAIPCCSHDLAGARFRAPPQTKRDKLHSKSTFGSSPADSPLLHSQRRDTEPHNCTPVTETQYQRGVETGSLGLRNPGSSGQAPTPSSGKKMPSAYSTLCSYTMSLTREMGYVAEHEVLRIPSTRNTCVVGRRREGERDVPDGALDETVEGLERRRVVRELVEREMGRSVEDVGREWIERAAKLGKKPGSGH